MKLRTAVIFSSGFGSRMLPVTATVQKELLPILDRPIIDYVVSDCVAAGITKIIFVIRPGSHGLQDYYIDNPTLKNHLERFNKQDALAKLEAAHSQALFSFIEQPADAGYGTAVPLIVAAPHLPKNEAFLVCGGDDFLWRTDGKSDFAALVQAFEDSGADGAVTGLKQPKEDLHKYGVLKVHSGRGGLYLDSIVEKPSTGEEPSNLINISKYVVTPELLDYVKRVKPDPKSGELYITDAISAAAADGHEILVHEAAGRYLDPGSLPGWLEANIIVARSRPELAKALKPD